MKCFFFKVTGKNSTTAAFYFKVYRWYKSTPGEFRWDCKWKSSGDKPQWSKNHACGYLFILILSGHPPTLPFHTELKSVSFIHVIQHVGYQLSCSSISILLPFSWSVLFCNSVRIILEHASACSKEYSAILEIDFPLTGNKLIERSIALEGEKMLSCAIKGAFQHQKLSYMFNSHIQKLNTRHAHRGFNIHLKLLVTQFLT